MSDLLIYASGAALLHGLEELFVKSIVGTCTKELTMALQKPSLPLEVEISYESMARELHGSINRMFIALTIMLLVQYLFFTNDASQQQVIISAGIGAGLAFYGMGVYALHRLHRHFPLKIKLEATGLTLAYKHNLDWLFAKFPRHHLHERVLPLHEIQAVQPGGEPVSFWLHQVKWTPSWQVITQSGEKLSIWLEDSSLDLKKMLKLAREKQGEFPPDTVGP